MIISMQGNWTVAVKSKNAAFPQRFVIQGAATGNGAHSGSSGTTVNVTGPQWSISIQNDPGTGWQSSETQLKYPQKIGGNYIFDIHSNDAGNDTDFNDLILSCSTPQNINDFIIYGNVSLYSGRCIFNPCRRFPFVIESHDALEKVLKNSALSDYIRKKYPERIPVKRDTPNPPDPDPFFKPMVLDLSGEATKPKTLLSYRRTDEGFAKKSAKKENAAASDLKAEHFELIRSSGTRATESVATLASEHLELAENIGGLFFQCNTEPGRNLTLTFEEYDRTIPELAGGAYSGTGNRRLLGDSITDMNGNYIFKFSFDMSFPGLEDAGDIASGEDVNTVMFPDVIIKIVEYSPYSVRYESAPYYNIANFRRIDLCLPEVTVPVEPFNCFNGNLIGSLGNVFIGGNQNSLGATSTTALTRHGYSNFLEPGGIISVESPLAGFSVQCAAWKGTIDMKGCMYDATKSSTDNKIKRYTIRVRRAAALSWVYVSQNQKHPRFYRRHEPGYIGDDVGPFYDNLGGTLDGTVPHYKNIQREVFVDGIDWEFSNLTRYMQLNTALYDLIMGTRTPGKFYVRVDGYDGAGVHVPGATDLIALFIHNNGLDFDMTTPSFTDPGILDAGCGLYRLTNSQLKTPVEFSFEASDPHGFVNEYALVIARCPGTALDLQANIEGSLTLTGSHTFPGGSNAANVKHTCPGYTGTDDDYSSTGMVPVTVSPTAAGDGWIKVSAGEYFTVYTLGLTATQRVTNGYNSGVSGTYRASSRIMMELLNP